jgi:hypothetical protein
MNKKTIISVAAAIITSGGLGFITGSNLDKKESSNVRKEQIGDFQNMRGTGQVGSAIPGGKGMGGGMVSGEVLSIDGQSITIKIQNGGSKIVLVPDDVKVTKSVSTDRSDIKQGENITVIGKANGNDSISAESIQIRPLAK